MAPRVGDGNPRVVCGDEALPAGGFRPRMLERDRELQQIDGAMAAAWVGRGGTLVIEGRPGEGRTRLLAAACDRGRAAGMCVLRARGGELEREHPFGVARQVFEPLLRRTPPEGRPAAPDDVAELATRLCGAGQPLAVNADSPATKADPGALCVA